LNGKGLVSSTVDYFVIQQPESGIYPMSHRSPIQVFLTAGSMLIFGQNGFAAKMVNVAGIVLFLFLVWWLAQLLFNRFCAWITVSLTIFNPLLNWYLLKPREDLWLLNWFMLTLLSVEYAFRRARSPKQLNYRWLISAGFFIGLAWLQRSTFGFLLILPTLVYLLLYRKHTFPKELSQRLASPLIVAITAFGIATPWLFYMLSRYGSFDFNPGFLYNFRYMGLYHPDLEDIFKVHYLHASSHTSLTEFLISEVGIARSIWVFSYNLYRAGISFISGAAFASFIIPFSLWGALQTWRFNSKRFLTISIGYATLQSIPVLLTSFEMRYLITWIPTLTLFGAYGLWLTANALQSAYNLSFAKLFVFIVIGMSMAQNIFGYAIEPYPTTIGFNISGSTASIWSGLVRPPLRSFASVVWLKQNTVPTDVIMASRVQGLAFETDRVTVRLPYDSWNNIRYVMQYHHVTYLMIRPQKNGIQFDKPVEGLGPLYEGQEIPGFTRVFAAVESDGFDTYQTYIYRVDSSSLSLLWWINLL